MVRMFVFLPKFMLKVNPLCSRIKNASYRKVISTLLKG